MAQFYFLSILLNVLAGFVLIYGRNLIQEKKSREIIYTEESKPKSGSRKRSKKSEPEEKEKTNTVRKIAEKFSDMDTKSSRLVLAVLVGFVGIMKLLSVFRNGVPVVGDLLPALAGLMASACLMVEFYSASASDESSVHPVVERIFVKGRKAIGVAAIVVAVVHFIFPQVTLL